MLVFAIAILPQYVFRKTNFLMVQSYAFIPEVGLSDQLTTSLKNAIFSNGGRTVRNIIVFCSHRSNRIWSLYRRISPALAPLTGLGRSLLSVEQARLVRLRP